MTPRETRCRQCPFTSVNQADRRIMASVPPSHWPCHTAGIASLQCRGHSMAQRYYPDEPVTLMTENIMRDNERFCSPWIHQVDRISPDQFNEENTF